MHLDIAKQAEIKAALSFCNGSEHFYKFQLCGNLYTDGIAQMASLCNASWLVTDALVVCNLLGKSYPFVVVNFEYTTDKEGNTALVTYEDGNDKVLHAQVIEVTDFPLETFKMFYENNTLYLPSER